MTNTSSILKCVFTIILVWFWQSLPNHNWKIPFLVNVLYFREKNCRGLFNKTTGLGNTDLRSKIMQWLVLLLCSLGFNYYFQADICKFHISRKEKKIIQGAYIISFLKKKLSSVSIIMKTNIGNPWTEVENYPVTDPSSHLTGIFQPIHDWFWQIHNILREGKEWISRSWKSLQRGKIIIYIGYINCQAHFCVLSTNVEFLKLREKRKMIISINEKKKTWQTRK